MKVSHQRNSMKKFLIPAFLVAFSVASVHAGDEKTPSWFSTPKFVTNSVEYVGKSIEARPWTSAAIAFVLGAATLKAVQYATHVDDEDSEL